MEPGQEAVQQKSPQSVAQSKQHTTSSKAFSFIDATVNTGTVLLLVITTISLAWVMLAVVVGFTVPAVHTYESHVQYSNEAFGIAFQYPAEWGDLMTSIEWTDNFCDGDLLCEHISFHAAGEYQKAQPQFLGIYGKELHGFFGGYIWHSQAIAVQSSDDIDTAFCQTGTIFRYPENCTTYTTENGLVVLKYEEPSDYAYPIVSYYLYPDLEYAHALVVSNSGFAQSGLGNPEVQLDSLVESLTVIK